jgi:transmembrane sensor
MMYGLIRAAQRGGDAMNEHAPNDSRNPAECERIARGWVVRLTSGAATQADADALGQWRAAHPANEAAYRTATRLWRDLRTPAASLEAKTNAFEQRRSVLISRRTMIFGALAASAAGAMILKPPFGLWPSIGERLDDLRADARTSIGERRQLQLAQNFALDLNTSTRIARGPTPTSITLISGEAFVEASLPFASTARVVAAEGELAFAQASLNVRCDDDVCVTCVAGSAELVHRGERWQLRPGDQIRYGSDAVRRVAITDFSLITAWRAGLLVFRDEPLEQVVHEVNRYRRGRILVANSALAQRRVSGTFHLDRIDEVLQQLHEAFGAHVRELPGNVAILS